MKAFSFEGMTLNNLPISLAKGEPQRFIPVFDTKEEALKWNDGLEENLKELEPIKKI